MSRRLVSLMGALLVAVAVAVGAPASGSADSAVVVAGDGHWCC